MVPSARRIVHPDHAPLLPAQPLDRVGEPRSATAIPSIRRHHVARVEARQRRPAPRRPGPRAPARPRAGSPPRRCPPGRWPGVWPGSTGRSEDLDLRRRAGAADRASGGSRRPPPSPWSGLGQPVEGEATVGAGEDRAPDQHRVLGGRALDGRAAPRRWAPGSGHVPHHPGETVAGPEPEIAFGPRALGRRQLHPGPLRRGRCRGERLQHPGPEGSPRSSHRPSGSTTDSVSRRISPPEPLHLEPEGLRRRAVGAQHPAGEHSSGAHGEQHLGLPGRSGDPVREQLARRGPGPSRLLATPRRAKPTLAVGGDRRRRSDAPHCGRASPRG